MKLTALLFIAAAFPMAQSSPATVSSRAGFMAGCWESSAQGAVMREEWRQPSGEFLIGTSSTTEGGVVKEFGFFRVEKDKAGAIAYVAQPGGAAATRFTLDPSSKADDITFVNMKHDFPKRIGYKKVAADALTAWIDGGPNSEKMEFAFKRCGK
jgi:hypothetical protein